MSGSLTNTIYELLNGASKTSLRGSAVANGLVDLCDLSLAFVREQADVVPLASMVPGKHYVMARSKGSVLVRTSRPINEGLFLPGMTRSEIEATVAGNMLGLSEKVAQQRLYTAAMSYPVAVEIATSGNKKSPATFFEIFVGHLIAEKLDVDPTTSIPIPSLDVENILPTDFIFDPGAGRAKFHVPVKLSTRERVVQAWAHQRVLEGMHGAGRFLGVLIVLAETYFYKVTCVVLV